MAKRPSFDRKMATGPPHTELKDEHEQRTAAKEVLELIARSRGELRPVFQSLLKHATRLCNARFGTLYLHEKGGLRLVSAHNVPKDFSEARRPDVVDLAPGGVLETAVRTKFPAHVIDLAQTQAYRERHPRMVEAVELAGIRTVVAVPMLREDQLVGVVAIHRREALPFAEEQIELLTMFAGQAVIAVENARLLNELRQRTDDLAEALEQQTATSDLLRIISSSPGDLEAVFHKMLENATRICTAKFGTVDL